MEVDIDIANTAFRRCSTLCRNRGAACVEQCFEPAGGARASYRSNSGAATELLGCTEPAAEVIIRGGDQLTLDGLTCCCL